MFGSMAENATRKPAMLRDSAYLAGADILAVFLALVGQVVLTRSLISTEYGLFVILLDLFATTFLLIDLGLPTLISRDGPNSPRMVWPAIQRVATIQTKVAFPFIFIGFLVLGLYNSDWRERDILVLFTLSIALVHISSYAPRSGLRAIGEARLEALTKLLERGVTVALYIILYYASITSVESYALAFLFGALIGSLSAYFLAWKNRSNNAEYWPGLGPVWVDDKTLILAALPFAITLAVLPYIIRIEKFILTSFEGLDAAAVFHVGQIAWLAGLVVPQAMRAALLPVLGEARENPENYAEKIRESWVLSLKITLLGIVCGSLIVRLLLPLAFPQEYFDGSLGESAISIFHYLLFGWAATTIATPFYTALQAGKNPWKFTGFVFAVVTFASIIGYLLIQQDPLGNRIIMAAISSSLSAIFLLGLAMYLCKDSYKKDNSLILQSLGLIGLSILFTLF